jgi:hypothetical protein
MTTKAQKEANYKYQQSNKYKEYKKKYMCEYMKKYRALQKQKNVIQNIEEKM